MEDGTLREEDPLPLNDSFENEHTESNVIGPSTPPAPCSPPPEASYEEPEGGQHDGPASPTGDGPMSPLDGPASPGEGPASPDGGPASPDGGPASPDACPASPENVNYGNAPVYSPNQSQGEEDDDSSGPKPRKTTGITRKIDNDTKDAPLSPDEEEEDKPDLVDHHKEPVDVKNDDETSQCTQDDDTQSIEDKRVVVFSDDTAYTRKVEQGQNGQKHDLKIQIQVNGKLSDEDKLHTSFGKTGLHDDHGELDYDEDDIEDDVHKRRDSKDVEMEEAEEGDDHSNKDLSDDGELDDDDDCEEGEIKEPGSRRPFIATPCRFYRRGHCTWGNDCRFLHPGVNDKGNYSLIERPQPPTGSVLDRVGVRGSGGGSWEREGGPGHVENKLPPPPEEPPSESAWERGLRHAKELMKRANKRKEAEPDFEEKRFNLSLEEEKEFNKENDRTRSYPKDPYYDNIEDEDEESYLMTKSVISDRMIDRNFDRMDRMERYERNMDRMLPADPWQRGHYENFEVRWSREMPEYRGYPSREHHPRDHHMRSSSGSLLRPEYLQDRPRPSMREPHHHNQPAPPPRHHKEPRHFSPPPPERRFEPRPRIRDERYVPLPPAERFEKERIEKFKDPPMKRPPPMEVAKPDGGQPSVRTRGDEWHDPWQRSKSPKRLAGVGRSRSRSRGRKRRRGSSAGSSSSYTSSSYDGSSRSRSRSSSYSSYTSRSSRSRSSSYSSGSSRSRSRGKRKLATIPGHPGHLGMARGRKPLVAGPMKPGEAPKSTVALKGMPGSRGIGPPEKKVSGPAPPPGMQAKMPPMKLAGDERGRKRVRDTRKRRSPSFSSSGSSRSYSSSSSRSGSSASSRSSSSSSSSGSADSDHLYRDIDAPAKKKDPLPKKRKGSPTPQKKSRRMPGLRNPSSRGGYGPEIDERMLRAAGPLPPPIKSAKDPLKVKGQKSNIQLTLINKQPSDKGMNNSLSKKRAAAQNMEAMAGPPPAKRPPKPVQKEAKTPTKAPAPARPEKAAKPATPVKSKGDGASSSKPAPSAASKKSDAAKGAAPSKVAAPAKAAAAAAPAAAAASGKEKAKKSTSSRREELLKQLKAVEDAILRKRAKMQ